MVGRVPPGAELFAVLGDTRADVIQGLVNLGFELVAEPLRFL